MKNKKKPTPATGLVFLNPLPGNTKERQNNFIPNQDVKSSKTENAQVQNKPRYLATDVVVVIIIL